MNVSLREITSETVGAVVDLSVRPDQQMYVASNAISLAEALFSKEVWYRAIYADDELAGFLMLVDETLRANAPEEPSICLVRLMIDARFQRRGIGKRVIEQLVDHVRSRPGVRHFYTSYVPGPEGPEKFYLSLGFVPNGKVKDGEVIVLYPLHGPTIA